MTMKRSTARRAIWWMLTLGLSSAVAPRPVQAWDAATTHAGLTEEAIQASRLGRLLTEEFGAPLGLYEPLVLEIPGERGARITRTLARLPAGDGYAPVEATLPALAWVVAGSVLEEVPVERVRHHFFDPTTGRGLDDRGSYLGGLGLRLSAAMAGAGFEGTGRPSLTWLQSADNDLGLAHFFDARERAVTAATPRERNAALAEALLIAGAVLHVIEDAAEPALVRNDYRQEFVQLGGPLRRWVAQRYGRLGVPPPAGEPTSVAHLGELITNPDGTGLADRTASRFFSLGTLPDRAGGRAPSVKPDAGPGGYVSAPGVPHLALWRREGERIAWTLDERCFADYAHVLLPEAGQAALSALEHLFRGRLLFDSGTVRTGGLGLGAGRLSFLAEDEAGRRKLLSSREMAGADADETLGEIPEAEGAKRLIVLFRGVDASGEPLVLSATVKLE